MRNPLVFIGLITLFCSCASTSRLHNEALQYALVGQNEMTIYSRLGAPTRTISASEGQKIMIYEFYNKGMFVTPYKSKLTYSAARDKNGNPQGLTFNSGSTVTNDSKYTVYQQDMSSLKVFLNKEGICARFEENLTKDQSEMYFDQFKRYIPKDKKKNKIK